MAKFTDAVVVTLKGYFDAGDQPTEAQFDALIDAIQQGTEEHDHDGTGDGDGIASIGITGITGVGVDVPNGWYLGIGAALERIVYSTIGYVSVMGAKFGVNELTPTEWLHITEDNVALAGPTVVLESNHSAGTQEMGRVHFKLAATTVGAIVGKEFTANEYGLALGTYGSGSLTTKVILYGSGILSLEGTTGALTLHRLTTAQRDALTAVNGMIIYNTTTNKIEGRENGAWVDI